MKKRHLHNRKRFLAPQARAGDGHGYLNQPQRELHGTLQHVDEPATIEKIAACTALCDEPEAMSDDIASYAELALKAGTLRHAREAQEAQEARSLLTPEQRLRNAEIRARQRHMDISRELHIIRQMLARARAGGRTYPESALRRLERVENRLDGNPEDRIRRLAA